MGPHTPETLTFAQRAGVSMFAMLTLASAMAWAAVVWRRIQGEQTISAAPPERRTWSRGMTVATLLIAAPWQVLALIPGEAKLDITLRTVQISCAISAALAAILVAVAHAVSPIRRTDLGLTCNLDDLAAGGLGFVLSWLPVCAVNYSVSGMRSADGKHPFFVLLDQDRTLTTLAWIAVSVAIVAPLLEELLYRVYLQGWLEQHLPPLGAISLSAFVFAGIHFSPGRPDWIPLLPLAFMLGYVYNRRRSLPAVMLLHGLFNGAMLLLDLMTHGMKQFR